jgi:hypothetical protein
MIGRIQLRPGRGPCMDPGAGVRWTPEGPAESSFGGSKALVAATFSAAAGPRIRVASQKIGPVAGELARLAPQHT